MTKKPKTSGRPISTTDFIGGFFIICVFIYVLFDPGTPGFAEFYKYTDSQGNTAYTNKRSKVPEAFQKNIEVIREEDLPPLKVSPEPQPDSPMGEKPQGWLPSIRAVVFLLPGILAVITVLFFFRKGFKFPAGRAGIKILIGGAIALGVYLLILFQLNLFQTRGSTNPFKAQSDIFPGEKIQRDVKEIEEDLRKQEKILESLSKNQD